MCHTSSVHILTFLSSEDPGSVTSLCPVVWPTCTRRCLRVIPEAYGRKPMPIYQGSDQRLSSSFTWTDSLWLPEETWTWELGAIQSIRFTHSSMCLPTCWGESRQPDEEAIPPRSIIKGKCLSARSMCCKLQCTHFLQEETERVMMQL